MIEKKFTDSESKRKKTTESQSLEQECDLKNNDSGGNSEDESLGLENKIKILEKENFELQEKIKQCLYVVAQNENDMRRLKNDIENQGKLVLQKFIKSTGPAIDDLIRGLKKSQDNALQMIFNKFIKAFEDNKIYITTPKIGEEFDPELHNAVSSTCNTELENNIIVDSLSGSYKVYDMVVLNAMVVVNKKESD